MLSEWLDQNVSVGSSKITARRVLQTLVAGLLLPTAGCFAI